LGGGGGAAIVIGGEMGATSGSGNYGGMACSWDSDDVASVVSSDAGTMTSGKS
jgi:hypothetical protein